MADNKRRGTSILDLPPELRLLIYDHFLQDPTVAIRCLAGSELETKSPWALLRVCRLLRHEATPMMPAISDVQFQFSNVEDGAMWRWCMSMGQERIGQMRKMSMDGSGVCLTGWDEASGRKHEAPACFRTITLDFARGFESPCTQQQLKQDLADVHFIPPTPPSNWRSLRALQSARFCQHGCLGCRYCTQVVAVGQVSKVEWSVDGQPLPTAELLMDLVDTTTKDISECLCPQGCGIEGCNHHRGELTTNGSTDAFLQLLRLRDYNERYLVD